MSGQVQLKCIMISTYDRHEVEVTKLNLYFLELYVCTPTVGWSFLLLGMNVVGNVESLTLNS